jgi:hypothetical protein
VLYYFLRFPDNRLSKVRAAEQAGCSSVYAKKDSACFTTIEGNLYMWDNKRERFVRNYEVYNTSFAAVSNYHNFALVTTALVDRPT